MRNRQNAACKFPSSSASQTSSSERPNRIRKTRLFKCPLCNGSFPASEIEQHASHCLEVNAPITTNPKKDSSSKRDNRTNGVHSRSAAISDSSMKSPIQNSRKADVFQGKLIEINVESIMSLQVQFF